MSSHESYFQYNIFRKPTLATKEVGLIYKIEEDSR